MDKSYESRPYFAKGLKSSSELERYMFEELGVRLSEFGTPKSFVPIITRNDWLQVSIVMIVITIFFIWTVL